MRRLWYRWFRSVSSLQHRLGRRLTPAGRLALAVLGAAAVVGLDTNRTLGSQVLALVGALLALAAAASVGFRVRLRARRVLPRFATAGQPVVYRVVLESESDARQDGLVLLDDLADPRPSFEEFARAREPGEERRNWFDRAVGYPRWMWFLKIDGSWERSPIPSRARRGPRWKSGSRSPRRAAAGSGSPPSRSRAPTRSGSCRRSAGCRCRSR